MSNELTTEANNVWQLSNELSRLDHMIEMEATENGGEISPELIQAFEELITYFDSEDVAQLIRKLRAEAEMFAAQAKRFQQVSTHRSNAMKALKASTIKIMESKGVRKDGPLAVCKNGGVLPMEIDESNVSKAYIKNVPTVDREKIREALNDGKELGFAALKERGQHVRVKG